MMIAETDVTARLEALGRALSTSVPLEPPAGFMHAVQHQRRVFVVKRAAAVVAGVLLVLALAYLARNVRSDAPRIGEGGFRSTSTPAGGPPSRVGAPDDVNQK